MEQRIGCGLEAALEYAGVGVGLKVGYGMLPGLWNIRAKNWRTHPRPQPDAWGAMYSEPQHWVGKCGF